MDLATRLARHQPLLRRRLAAPRTLVALLAAMRDSIDPLEIAERVLVHAAQWVPARAWAIGALDLAGQTSILAQKDVTPEMAVTLPSLVAHLTERGRPLSSASLRGEAPFATAFAGSAIGLPLSCRQYCFGAIIGLDPRPSVRPPHFAPATLKALQPALDAIAAALDKTLLLKRAEALSVTDDLTRLYNSRYLNQVLRREVKRAARSGRPVSLLFIDLDGFKLINDTYGHLSGSAALVEAGAVIRGSARETDVAARFGGDEFALVLPETGAPGALAVAERVCDRIAHHGFLGTQGLTIRLTASVGVATLPDAASGPDELVEAADRAMYQVKNRGKNGLQAAPALTDK